MGMKTYVKVLIQMDGSYTKEQAREVLYNQLDNLESFDWLVVEDADYTEEK